MKQLFILVTLGSFSIVGARPYMSPEYMYKNSYQNERNDQGQYDNAYDQKGAYYQMRSQQDPSFQRDVQRSDGMNGSNLSAKDIEIQNKIRDLLGSGWFTKGFQNVIFEVDNGNVLLHGTVNTPEDKQKIEDNIRKIDGINHIHNHIAIVKENPDNYTVVELQEFQQKYPQDFAASAQDRQVNAKIRDKVGNGWYSKDYETLAIKTTNGAVVIYGTVKKIENIQKMNDQIKDIPGVKTVDNKLTVINK